MMTKYQRTLIILSFGFILPVIAISCNNNQTEHSHENEAMHHKHEDMSMMKLNNGEKWEANPETNEGISRMEAIIQEELSANEETNCIQVKEKLIAEYDFIIKECTMSGEAHDQLHTYLIPLSAYIKELNTTDQVICKNTINKIDKHIAGYYNYFY